MIYERLVSGSDIIDIEGLWFGHGIPVARVRHNGRTVRCRVVTKPDGVTQFMDEHALNKVGQVGCISGNRGGVEFDAEVDNLIAGDRSVVDTISGIVEVASGDRVRRVIRFDELHFGSRIVPVGKRSIHWTLPCRSVVVGPDWNGGTRVAVIQKGCCVDRAAKHRERREQHQAHQQLPFHT